MDTLGAIFMVGVALAMLTVGLALTLRGHGHG